MNWTRQGSWLFRLTGFVLLVLAASGTWKLAGLSSEPLTLDLGTLSGGDFSRANDLNSRGQIVGESSTAVTSNHAFLFTDGVMIDLGVLPGVTNPFAGSSASAINDHGQVVGYSSASNNGPVHAFLFSDGLMRDLGTLDGIFAFGDSLAVDINDAGHVIGNASEPESLTRHAFLFDGSQMHDLGTLPGGRSSYAGDINNSGQVVGYADTSSGRQHGFLFSEGVMTDVGTLPGHTDSFATSISESGVVFGYCVGPNGNRAFQFSGGLLTDLGATQLGTVAGSDFNHLQAFSSGGLAAGWSKTREGALGQIHAFRFMATPVFVPVVLSAFAQTGGALFTSEMILANRGPRPAAIRFNYKSAIGTGTGSTNSAAYLDAGQQRVIPNTISYLRGQGLPISSEGNQVGTLSIGFYGLSSASDAAAVIRTTAGVDGGQAGLAYPGISPSSALVESAYLTGLRQNDADRSNVAFQNVGQGDAGNITLRLTVFSGNTANPVSRTLPDEILAPGGFRQISGILGYDGLSLDQGYIRVERVNGTAPYYAYAVINDQKSADGSFIPPLLESSLVGRTGLTLPAVVEANSYSTELIVTNWSLVRKSLKCTFQSEGIQTAGSMVEFNIEANPGEQLILPDLIQRLRDVGVVGIPKGPSYAGAMFAKVSSGDLTGLSVSARTSAPAPSGGGRFGLFYPAVPQGMASASSAWVFGLQQDSNNRSNLALINTGETDESTDVLRIELFDGNTGRRFDTIEGVNLQARGFIQFSSILSFYSPKPQNGYVRITRIGGNNPFIAYGLVNDGGTPGHRTGDGAFLSSFP
jgi:probable HAF family extracellular repeat protein